MSYQLKKSKRVPDDVRRVVLEQLDKALDRLKVKTGNKDEAIHGAPVCFKKLRAVLRLTRYQLDGAFQEDELYPTQCHGWAACQ